MINKEIIRIASNTSNVGLNNKYSHKISLKNKLCGDKITLELIVTKQKIISMMRLLKLIKAKWSKRGTFFPSAYLNGYVNA